MSLCGWWTWENKLCERIAENGKTNEREQQNQACLVDVAPPWSRNFLWANIGDRRAPDVQTFQGKKRNFYEVQAIEIELKKWGKFYSNIFKLIRFLNFPCYRHRHSCVNVANCHSFYHYLMCLTYKIFISSCSLVNYFTKSSDESQENTHFSYCEVSQMWNVSKTKRLLRNGGYEMSRPGPARNMSVLKQIYFICIYQLSFKFIFDHFCENLGKWRFRLVEIFSV